MREEASRYGIWLESLAFAVASLLSYFFGRWVDCPPKNAA